MDTSYHIIIRKKGNNFRGTATEIIKYIFIFTGFK